MSISIRNSLEIPLRDDHVRKNIGQIRVTKPAAREHKHQKRARLAREIRQPAMEGAEIKEERSSEVSSHMFDGKFSADLGLSGRPGTK